MQYDDCPDIESQLPIMLRPKQVAELLGVSTSYARALFRRDDFPSALIGARRLVLSSDFLEWLDRQTIHKEGTDGKDRVEHRRSRRAVSNISKSRI